MWLAGWWGGSRKDLPVLCTCLPLPGALAHATTTIAVLLLLQDGEPGSTAADADDGGYSGAEGQVLSLPAPDAVRLAAQIVAAVVSKRIQGGPAAALPLEAADKQASVGAEGWKDLQVARY